MSEAMDAVVSFILGKISDLDSRKISLETRHDASLKEIREQRHVFVKLLQEACPHTDKKNVGSYNYHKNEDDSYDECITCGKHL